ncbi:MBL fold metallo-hydrolase [Halorubrum laminariae]|uniref:MBL fold metallo-hydrolase n=1 Tax=Halorubrum laminariae TaxID=1433523 RepID=A0ABD6C3Z3_9EURY|nr:MBL fold metallo-hydrolase [Halorubrum laminariae]
MTEQASSPAVTRVEIQVDTRAPGGTTNAYLVDGLLVDPAARTDALDAAVGIGDAADKNAADSDADDHDAASPHSIETIAVTHAHPDHVGAVSEYADLTDATVVAHANFCDRFADATEIEPDEIVCDGDQIGDSAVVAVETPGHAADHLAFAVGGGGDESGDRGEGNADGRTADSAADGTADGATDGHELICGDLAVADGSVVVGAPDGDLDAYLASLQRVRDAGYERIHPGHGPPIDDPAATCQRLIDHRLARERSVLDAIERGASDVDAVLDAAYEKDLSGVEDLARATVVAHLRKLLAEGRIGSAWTERLDCGCEH